MLKLNKPICWKLFCDIGMTYVPKPQSNKDTKHRHIKPYKWIDMTFIMQAIEYNCLINSEKTYSLIQRSHYPNNQRSKIFNSKMAIKCLVAGKVKAKFNGGRQMIMLDNKKLEPKSQHLPTTTSFVYC